MKPPIFHRMFEYDRALIPNAHLASLERDVIRIDQAQERTGATIGFPGWGLIYHLLLSHLDRSRDQLIVETGTNWGCTTIILAQALVDSGCSGRVVTFEIEDENIGRAQTNFAAAGLSDRIEVVVGDSGETLPNFMSTVQDCRTVLLDASHLEDDVRAEFEAVLPHLALDALVIMDNTFQIATDGEDQLVNGFLRTMTETYGGNLINLEYVSWYTPGLAIWQKEPKL